MAELYQRYRTTLTATQEFAVTPGYRYTIFVGAFGAGNVTVDVIGSDRFGGDKVLPSGLGTVTTTGILADYLAMSGVIRVNLNAGATSVYVEINLQKTVANSENYI